MTKNEVKTLLDYGFSVSEIAEMEKWEDSRINEKKEVLAYELTSLVHGEE